MKTCTVENCDGKIKSGNLYCEKHRARVRRHGSPDVVLKDHTPAAERWKKNYEEDIATECWNWTGTLSHGYGVISDGAQKRHQAHRFVYEQLVGPIPDGLELDHLCRNPRCINPKHLEPVTHLINVQRGEAGIRNAEKEFCKNGHHFTPENTIISKDGHRNCRLCQRKQIREYMRKKRGTELVGPPQPNAKKTHCKYGHEYTPENTIRTSNGGRNCRECSRRQQREYHQRKRRN